MSEFYNDLYFSNPYNKTTILDDKKNKYKVFAYCRVSTDKNDQRNSLVAQEEFFYRLKKEHPNWESFEIFSDEGISGTSLKNRNGFLEMIRRAKNGEANLIITKEISRLSRNIRDTLNVIEDLRNNKIAVFFYIHKLNSIDINDYQQICNLAAAAQAESFATSERVKIGQALQMKNGTTFGRKEMLGYRIERDSITNEQIYQIVEEEAEVIRKIFTWFAEGDGTHRIARKLEAEGTPTFRYSNGWSNVVILRLLRNEKYVGDLRQGKTFTPDMLTHQKKLNKNTDTIYECRNHHQPIVDRELWDKVQKRLKDNEPSEEQKLKHSNRYWLSGKVFCGVCGGRYVSKPKKLKNGTTYKSWVCFETQNRGTYKEDTIDGIPRGCNSGGMINDLVFRYAVHDLIEYFIKQNASYLISEVEKRYSETEIKNLYKESKKKINEIEKKIKANKNKLQKAFDFYLEGKVLSEVYTETQAQIGKELEELENLKRKHFEILEKSDSSKSEAEELKENIKYLTSLSDKDFTDELYERVTKKIVVYPEHIIEIHLTGFSMPFYMQFTARGKMHTYSVDFTVLSKDEAFEIIGDRIRNR